MSRFHPKNVLAISGAGIVPMTSPRIVAYAWAKTDAPAFAPQFRKRALVTINWTRLHIAYPGILKDIAKMRSEFGEIDLVLVDYSFRKGIKYSLSLSHYILGCTQCPSILFVRSQKWFAAMIGPEAALYDDDPAFDDMVIEYMKIRFPYMAPKINSPQVARCLALLYYGVAKYGGVM